MIHPHLEYIDSIIDSSRESILKIGKLQDKTLRRIEYCNNLLDRLEYDELRRQYNIEQLLVRRKRSLLRIMYNQSENGQHFEVVEHNIGLQSRCTVKMKNKFSDLSNIHESPYYRGCSLWSKLPEAIKKSENINVFKGAARKYIK